jgi:hypothetical protein
MKNYCAEAENKRFLFGIPGRYSQFNNNAYSLTIDFQRSVVDDWKAAVRF